jgi:steroid delta-isomerase
MPDAAAIRATVERYMAAFTAADRDTWVGQFTADATLEDPVGSDVRHGHDGIGEFWDSIRGLADEMVMSGTGPVRVAGTEAAFPFKIRTKLGDDWMVLDVIDAMAFVDDPEGSGEARIATMRAFWDMADMLPEG